MAFSRCLYLSDGDSTASQREIKEQRAFLPASWDAAVDSMPFVVQENTHQHHFCQLTPTFTPHLGCCFHDFCVTREPLVCRDGAARESVLSLQSTLSLHNKKEVSTFSVLLPIHTVSKGTKAERVTCHSRTKRG